MQLCRLPCLPQCQNSTSNLKRGLRVQGIVTADVLPLEAPGAAPQYACMLNAQGRHLHDLLLFRTAGGQVSGLPCTDGLRTGGQVAVRGATWAAGLSHKGAIWWVVWDPLPDRPPPPPVPTSDAEPTVLADVDAAGMEDLLRLLKRYRLRQKLDIQDVSQQYRVWARWGGAAGDSGAPPPGWAPDPRLPQLGLRAVLPRGGEGEGAGGSCGWEAHRRWRMLHGVAEGDSEIPSSEELWGLGVAHQSPPGSTVHAVHACCPAACPAGSNCVWHVVQRPEACLDQ